VTIPSSRSLPSRPSPPRAVTFDCWGTLIHERETHSAYAVRVSALRRSAESTGAVVASGSERAALDSAWSRHWSLWHEGVASGPREIADWALAELGVCEATASEELAREFAEAALASDVLALAGAATTLERLAAAGVRRALICDTGFTPGKVVRQLLAGAGLLQYLEVLVFSDEAGVPKPDAKVFHTALEALGVPARAALHVGDLRRTDVAGARAAGMGTVRISDHHDDLSDHPEADHVVDSHAQLCEILALEARRGANPSLA
jgi:putative hydrolase of the HAD superfamily